MRWSAIIAAGGCLVAPAFAASGAEPVMVRCGRDYQAARSAGTLNGMDWNSFRVACADRLKGIASAPAASPVAPTAAPALPPASAQAAPPGSASSGTAAMHARQKQCGAEWRAGKASLMAQRPDLSWPRFWSECNSRLKAAGG